MSTDVCHGSIAFTGCYELPLTRRLCEIAKTEGGTLIDAGANYGYYSLLWTAAKATNRVIAFEASPRNYPALMANLELNGVADRVTPINQAVGDKIGTVCFKMSDSNQSGWDKITTDQSESQWKIPMTTIDLNIGDTQITAIDCEGYDFNVIAGAKDLIATRQVKHIFFEENPGCAEKFGIASGDVSAHLTSCGYTVTPLGGPTEFEASLKA
ncbi:MAG: FkbM family methyltransferase [Verrucomicrobiales bacterium]|nr:FkbM family methyltransferase [Verrucomicrobiales bacterium]